MGPNAAKEKIRHVSKYYKLLYGTKMAQHTQVWAAYDKTSLYFAFRCLDPEPDKIKSAISRRDTLWNDDWVGISLDALGSHQSSNGALFERQDWDGTQFVSGRGNYLNTQRGFFFKLSYLYRF